LLKTFKSLKMVDCYPSVTVTPFHEDRRAIYRVLSPPQPPAAASPNDYDGNAPLNLCIKSEDTSKEENLNVRLNQVKIEQEAGRLRFYREVGYNSTSVKMEEYETGRHSSGESMDSGIFMQHADESTEALNNLQWHSNRNSVECGNIGGMVEQRHYSADSMGDPCQELGNLLIVSTLDTDIANEEIVECVDSVEFEEADMEDNLIIDDNADAGTDVKMEVTGKSTQSKYNDLKLDEKSRDTILNRKYNYNNRKDTNMEKLREYLVKEEVHENEPSLLEHQINTSSHLSSSPDDSSQDSLQLLAAASMERSATSTLAATAAVDYGDGLDGPLHLLAAIAMSAKANSDVEYKQPTATSQSSSFTSSIEAAPSIQETTSSSIMNTEQSQPAAAAKRLRYHSWPQMATMTSSQRKKEQNKLASKRFRERKKQQIEQARIEIMELEVRNDLLKKKEAYMKSERENLRCILLEQNLIKIVKLPDGQTTVVATTEMPKRLSSA